MYNPWIDRGVSRRLRNRLLLRFSELNLSGKDSAGDNRVVENSNFDGETLVDNDHASNSNARAEYSSHDGKADVCAKRNLFLVVGKRLSYT